MPTVALVWYAADQRGNDGATMLSARATVERADGDALGALRSRATLHRLHAPLRLPREKLDHVALRRSARGDRAEPGEVQRVERRLLPSEEAIQDELRRMELPPQLLGPGLNQPS
jgi:hypothetical protein